MFRNYPRHVARHKEIILRENSNCKRCKKILAGSWYSLLRPVISRLVKVAPSSPLSSLFGYFFAPRSPTDDRWSKGDRARSIRPDIIARLLIDFCRVVFCANFIPPAYIPVSSRPSSRRFLVYPSLASVTIINSKNRSNERTNHVALYFITK